MIVNCEVVTRGRLCEIEQCREEPDPPLSLDITGKNFEMPTSSVQHIEQVERVIQSIVNQLVNPVNQQVGRLEAIVSKIANLNDDRQNSNEKQS